MSRRPRAQPLRDAVRSERVRECNDRRVRRITELGARGLDAADSGAPARIDQFARQTRLPDSGAALDHERSAAAFRQPKNALHQELQLDRTADELAADDTGADHVAGAFPAASYTSCMKTMLWFQDPKEGEETVTAPEDQAVAADDDTTPMPGGGPNTGP